MPDLQTNCRDITGWHNRSPSKGNLVINSLWLSHNIWHRTGSTLVQVMACCHQATSHYMNQCWPVTVRSWPGHSPEGKFIQKAQDIYPWYKKAQDIYPWYKKAQYIYPWYQYQFENYPFKITITSPSELNETEKICISKGQTQRAVVGFHRDATVNTTKAWDGGLLSQFPVFLYFHSFPELSKHWLPAEYHFHIWQDWCCRNDTCEIWKWSLS